MMREDLQRQSLLRVATCCHDNSTGGQLEQVLQDLVDERVEAGVRVQPQLGEELHRSKVN